MTRTNPSQDKPMAMQRTKPARKPHCNYNLPGRKGVYDDDIPDIIYRLTTLGARQVDIAQSLRVHLTSLEQWLKNKPECRRALDAGKDDYKFGVVSSLSKRAQGYNYIERKETQVMDKEGNVHTLVSETHKHIPPDIGAMAFWLKNQFPDQWADVHKQEINSKVNVNIKGTLKLDQLTEEEKKLLDSINLKQIATLSGHSSN